MHFTLNKKIGDIFSNFEVIRPFEVDPLFDHFQNADMGLSEPKG